MSTILTWDYLGISKELELLLNRKLRLQQLPAPMLRFPKIMPGALPALHKSFFPPGQGCPNVLNVLYRVVGSIACPL